MNFFKKQWEAFKAKSWWGKTTDILFIVFLVMMLTKDGRILFQRAILATGIFGSVSVNEDAPISEENWNWKLYDLEGEEHRLAEFRGKPIFLNFWATWCPPCNAEMPYVQEMIDESDGDVVFIVATSEEFEKVKSFLAEKEWDLPVYVLGSYPVAELQYRSLPTSVVIDANGRMVHRSEGMRKWSWDGLQEILNSGS